MASITGSNYILIYSVNFPLRSVVFWMFVQTLSPLNFLQFTFIDSFPFSAHCPGTHFMYYLYHTSLSLPLAPDPPSTLLLVPARGLCQDVLAGVAVVGEGVLVPVQRNHAGPHLGVLLPAVQQYNLCDRFLPIQQLVPKLLPHAFLVYPLDQKWLKIAWNAFYRQLVVFAISHVIYVDETNKLFVERLGIFIQTDLHIPTTLEWSSRKGWNLVWSLLRKPFPHKG